MLATGIQVYIEARISGFCFYSH